MKYTSPVPSRATRASLPPNSRKSFQPTDSGAMCSIQCWLWPLPSSLQSSSPSSSSSRNKVSFGASVCSQIMFCHLSDALCWLKVFLWIWQSVPKWMKPHWWWEHLAQTVRCTEFPHLETTHLTMTTTTRSVRKENWRHNSFLGVKFLGQVMGL